jgi:hypothetical protein
MTGKGDERCCLPTEPCRECLAYYAWLNRDLDRGPSTGEDDRNDDIAKSRDSDLA